MTSNISKTAKICPGAIIGDNVTIEDDVYIEKMMYTLITAL